MLPLLKVKENNLVPTYALFWQLQQKPSLSFENVCWLTKIEVV